MIRRLFFMFFVLLMGTQILGPGARGSAQFGDSFSDQILKSGWYPWDPYQYERVTLLGDQLEGLDIKLTDMIMKRAKMGVTIDPVPWGKHLDELAQGKRDMAVGAAKTPEREVFSYYSIPYRYEKDSLFVLKKDRHKYDFSSPDKMMDHLEKNDFRLAVIRGYRYVEPRVLKIIDDPANAHRIVYTNNDMESLGKLLNGEVDGFLADYIVGPTILWRLEKRREVMQIDLPTRAPLHFIFSKKTVKPEVVQRVNKAIEDVQASGEMRSVFKAYLHPVLLLQTIDTKWFFVIELLGTAAFAISGLIIAYKERTTIMGAFVLSALPPVAGGVVRDLMLDRNPLNFLQTPIMLMVVLIVVTLGYIYVRFLRQRILPLIRLRYLVRLRMEGARFLVVTDSIGLATFAIVGVTVSMEANLQPLWLWGPFFAVVTGSAGGIMRDVTRKDRRLEALRENFGPETAALTGLIFALLIEWQSFDIDPEVIFWTVVAVVIFGASVRIYALFSGRRPWLFTDKPNGHDL